MSGFPTVATVLLVAVEPRQRVLAPWLRVIGEPVSYVLAGADPRDVPSGGLSDVVVVDGESARGDEAGEQVLINVRERCAFAPVLYVEPCRPSLADARLAFAWADDTIGQGEDFGDQLRRRVQNIALAPWRRAVALRLEAERLGDRRLRVLRPARHASVEDQASAPELVASALQTLLDELDQMLEALSPELVRELSKSGSELGSPSAAARFGAGLAFTHVRCELWRLAGEGLAAVERRGAYPLREQ